MRELNSAQEPIGGILRLPRPVDFRDGRACSRLRAEATIHCKNNTGVAADLTGAKVKAAMAAVFSIANLKFGTKALEVVDNGLAFARAREMLIKLSNGLDDFIIAAADGTYGPKKYQNVADADVVHAAVAAGATFDVVVEYVRAFEVDDLGQDAYKYCPGASQMRQVQWDWTAAPWVDATFALGAATDVTFVADDFEAHDDKWVSVPRLYQQEEAGRVSHGPGGNLGLLAMWEYTSAGAATPLTVFSVERDGDSPVQDKVRASRVVRDALLEIAGGAYDLNALVTLLFRIPANAEPADIPTGSGFRLEQTGSELAPPKTAWLYVPSKSAVEWDEAAGKNVEQEEETTAISASTKASRGQPSPVAGLEGVILARAGSSDAETLPGRRYKTGQVPTEHIPSAVAEAAKQVASSAGGAHKAAGAIARALPGGTSAKRGISSIRAALAARFRR